jgi:hypothetical protein
MNDADGRLAKLTKGGRPRTCYEAVRSEKDTRYKLEALWIVGGGYFLF